MKNVSQGFSKFNTVDIAAVRIELRNGEIVELRDSFTEFETYRSMFTRGLSGSLIFIDTIGLTNNGPILGGERVYLKWRSTAYEEYTELTMRVAMLVEREVVSQAKCIVRLELCSESLYLGSAKYISRGLNGQYSNISETLWRETGVDVPYMKDESLGIIKIATGMHMNVLDTIIWMASRAKDSSGLPFCFFEDYSGLNFASWYRILTQDTSVKFIHQPQGTEEDIRKDWMNILAVQTEQNTRDALGFMEESLGNHKDLAINLNEKTIDSTTDTFANVVSGFGLSGGKLSFPEAEKCESVDLLLTRQDGSERNNFEREVLNFLTSYSKTIICNHGDDKARLGQVIECNFLSPQTSIGRNPTKEEFFSGKYLVTSIRDTVRPNEYRTYRGLLQESLKNEV